MSRIALLCEERRNPGRRDPVIAGINDQAHECMAGDALVSPPTSYRAKSP